MIIKPEKIEEIKNLLLTEINQQITDTLNKHQQLLGAMTAVETFARLITEQIQQTEPANPDVSPEK